MKILTQVFELKECEACNGEGKIYSRDDHSGRNHYVDCWGCTNGYIKKLIREEVTES